MAGLLIGAGGTGQNKLLRVAVRNLHLGASVTSVMIILIESGYS